VLSQQFDLNEETEWIAFQSFISSKVLFVSPVPDTVLVSPDGTVVFLIGRKLSNLFHCILSRKYLAQDTREAK
jgi:hypothetical protein